MNSIPDARGSARLLARSIQSLEQRFESVASNLANVETPGHKRMLSRSEQFQVALDRARGSGAPTLRDFRQGTLQPTQNPLDLALEGPGMLAVEYHGELVFTRAVKLGVDSSGFLIDQRGARLVGNGGPIRVGEELGRLQVKTDGTLVANDTPAGRLRVVEFADIASLTDLGGGLYQTPPDISPTSAKGTQVRAGHRERSNVEPLIEMVEMISIQRQQEAATRALSQTFEMQERLFRAVT